MKKRLEATVKQYLENNPSAVKPEIYSKRFCEAMNRVIGHNIKARSLSIVN